MNTIAHAERAHEAAEHDRYADLHDSGDAAERARRERLIDYRIEARKRCAQSANETLKTFLSMDVDYESEMLLLFSLACFSLDPRFDADASSTALGDFLKDRTSKILDQYAEMQEATREQ